MGIILVGCKYIKLIFQKQLILISLIVCLKVIKTRRFIGFIFYTYTVLEDFLMTSVYLQLRVKIYDLTCWEKHALFYLLCQYPSLHFTQSLLASFNKSNKQERIMQFLIMQLRVTWYMRLSCLRYLHLIMFSFT